MAASEAARSLYREIVVDKSLSLSDFFEKKRPLLLSQSDDEKEAAFSELIELLSLFPDDFLPEQQVGLLLDFFLGIFESSPITASFAVPGIHHLLLHSKNLPPGTEGPVVQIMFRDGNVQGWDLEKRLMQYAILEWLLMHRINELSVLGSDFVLTFIRTIGGERHPRCLPQVFRMFVVVARSFPLGPFAEDLFEAVACYFPVEFKQPSGDVPITRELLAHGCLKCLTAHRDFAPYCYLLIEEKFTDDECTIEQKHDVCELLALAASTFRPDDIIDNLEAILGGLRAIGLNNKAPMHSCVLKALAAVTTALNDSKTEAVTKIAAQLIENLEPFVLQAEMGLTERALTLLQCVTTAGSGTRSLIFDRVIPWILMLVQSDVVNVKANRLEIVQEGLRCLVSWVDHIHQHNGDDVLRRFESSLFASLQQAREIAPTEALAALYKCSAIYLKVDGLPVDVAIRIADLVQSSWDSVKDDLVREAFSQLVSTLAEVNWKCIHEIVISKNNGSYLKLADFIMICSAVHDESSLTEMSPLLLAALVQNPSREVFVGYLNMATRLSHAAPSLLPLLSEKFQSAAFQMSCLSREVIAAFAETMQSFGLLLSKEERLRLTAKISSSIASTQHFDMFCLFLVQSQSPSILRDLVKSPFCEEESCCRMCTGIANHDDDIDGVFSLRERLPFDIDCALAEGLLLRGASQGLTIFDETLSRLCRSDADDYAQLCRRLEEMFDLESPPNDPVRCLYKLTFLWKQRVCSQLCQSYVKAVNSADEAGKNKLMRLLPSVLKLSSMNPAPQQQSDQFVPVFLLALSAENPIPVIFSALPRLIASLSEEKIRFEDGRRIIEALTRRLMEDPTPMKVALECLESLELAAKHIPHCISTSTSGMVVGATTKALGHSKRVVRQKAASVRNLWEAKRLE
ncbi:hypothetical protein Q1695_001929 [Nippostrongylus brasiliensis]|nr:hypothetical protein Q1695_001929 [Nippostrongylus brasiliensis]